MTVHVLIESINQYCAGFLSRRIVSIEGVYASADVANEEKRRLEEKAVAFWNSNQDVNYYIESYVVTE